MFALVKKDFFIPRTYEYVLISVLLLFTHLSASSPYFLFIIFCMSFPILLMVYDHYYKLNYYIKSLPLEPKKIILSKFLSSFIFLIGLLVFQVLFMLVIQLNTYDPLYYIYNWQDIIIIFSVGLSLIAIVIMVFHLFKSIYLAATVLAILFISGIVIITDSLVTNMNVNNDEVIVLNQLDVGYQIIVEKYIPGNPYLTLIFIAVGLLISSYFISLYIFKKRDIV